MSLFGDLVERLARPPEEIRAENLRHWSATIPGVCALGELVCRERYRVAGVVHNIRIDPRQGRDSIEATITDGSGELIVKWLGRHDLSGIKLGVGLIVEATIGQTPDGELMVLNPEYDLVPGPEHG